MITAITSCTSYYTENMLRNKVVNVKKVLNLSRFIGSKLGVLLNPRNAALPRGFGDSFAQSRADTGRERADNYIFG